MLEISRLNEGCDCFEVDFLEREATPEPAMKLGIRLHLAGLSLSDTVSILDRLGVDRCRSTVHNWVQKADLQPVDGADPDHLAVDETVIQLNDDRYWLYAVTRTLSVLVVVGFPRNPTTDGKSKISRNGERELCSRQRR